MINCIKPIIDKDFIFTILDNINYIVYREVKITMPVYVVAELNLWASCF